LGKLLFIHRWTGVGLALFMTLWLGSGLIVVLTEPPTPNRAAQLAHAEPLAPQGAWLDPAEAFARSGKGPLPGEARLVRIAGEAYWLFRPVTGDALALSAIDGTSRSFDAEDAEKIAATWLGASAEEGPSIVYLNTGEAPAFVRNGQGLGPFHRLAVEDGKGTQIIVSSRTGEIVAVGSAYARALYYAGSWIHTLHPLDFMGEMRRTVLAWLCGIAFVASLTGIVIGWIRWRPGFVGRPTYPGRRTQPYRRFWHATHFWTGLLGGLVATIWAFSGFLTTNPGEIFFSPANASAKETVVFTGGAQGLSPLRLPAGAAEGLAEIVWRRLGGETIAFGLTPDGAAWEFDGVKAQFDRPNLIAAATRLAGDRALAGVEEIADYDFYYYRNRRQDALDRPLPALRVDFADAAGTRLYIDAEDGRLLLKQDSSRRTYRWLFSALHHWDLPWLTAWRPVWTGWMLIWVSLGLGLAISSVYLGARRLKMTWQARQIARQEARDAAQENAKQAAAHAT
jgi:PepSY-associated TM region